MIVEGLQSLAVPIDSVRPLERNARRGNVEAIKKSLVAFGQRRPIVVRSDTGEVTAGNHMLLAAIELGWTEVAAIVVDDDEQTALAWSLADNRSHDLGGYDDAELDALLVEMADHDLGLVEAAGFDVDEILSTLAPDADDFIPFGEAQSIKAEREAEVEGGEIAVTNPQPEVESSPSEEVKPLDAYEQFAERATAEPIGAADKLKKEEWVILQFREIRARVRREVYDEFYERVLAEVGGNRTKVGPAMLVRMGFPAEEALEATARMTYADRGR